MHQLWLFWAVQTKPSYPSWLAHAGASNFLRIHYCRSSVSHQNHFHENPSQFEWVLRTRVTTILVQNRMPTIRTFPAGLKYRPRPPPVPQTSSNPYHMLLSQFLCVCTIFSLKSRWNQGNSAWQQFDYRKNLVSPSILARSPLSQPLLIPKSSG